MWAAGKGKKERRRRRLELLYFLLHPRSPATVPGYNFTTSSLVMNATPAPSPAQRDLKPQNLLLSDSGPSPTLKIADFGFARSLQPAGVRPAGLSHGAVEAATSDPTASPPLHTTRYTLHTHPTPYS